MQKGSVQMVVYYVLMLIIFMIINFAFKQPAHGSGSSILFLLMVLCISLVTMFFNLICIMINKNKPWNQGSFIVHVIVLALVYITFIGAFN